MSKKNIINLVKIQVESFRKTDYLLPFFGVAFIMILAFIVSDDLERSISVFAAISLIIGSQVPVEDSIMMFFVNNNVNQKITLPARMNEKFVSIYCVAFIKMLMWFVSIILGVGAVCIIGVTKYSVSAAQVADMYFASLDISLLFILIYFAAVISLWQMSSYTYKKIKIKSRTPLVLLTILMFVLDVYLPDDIADIVMPLYIIVTSIIFFSMSYRCFRLSQVVKEKMF